MISKRIWMFLTQRNDIYIWGDKYDNYPDLIIAHYINTYNMYAYFQLITNKKYEKETNGAINVTDLL
jgi:hypothetical protein